MVAEVEDAAMPVILLLVDALDESDDGGQGWPPMARLIANQ